MAGNTQAMPVWVFYVIAVGAALAGALLLPSRDEAARRGERLGLRLLHGMRDRRGRRR